MKNHILKLLYLGLSLTLCLCGCGNSPDTPDRNSSSEESISAEATTSAHSDITKPNDITSTASGFHDPSEVTVESLIPALIPDKICDTYPVFQVTNTYSGNNGTDSYNETCLLTFGKVSDSIYEFSESFLYSNGESTKVYMTNDPNDSYTYAVLGTMSDKSPLSEGIIESTFLQPIFDFENGSYKMIDVTEKDGIYNIEFRFERTNTLILEFDPAAMLVLSGTQIYKNSEQDKNPMIVTYLFDYSGTNAVDYSAKTEALKAEAEAASARDQNVIIDTTTIYDDPFTNADLQNAKLVLLNFWEPWCGPCVGEMPDLQVLYDKYKDQGLVILGIYTTFDMDADGKALLADKGITYPILRCSEALNRLSQNYVPASYFMSPEGKILSPEPVAGAKSYDEWEKMIQQYLNQ